VAVAALAAGIIFAGFTQLRNAPVDMHPEFSPTIVEVQTEALGLSATEVEQLITVPLEADLLNGVAWLDDIRSESIPGLSSIVMTFEPGTALYRARQVVQERIAQAAVALPAVSKPPQMLQPVSSTGRAMIIGLTSETLSLIDISQLARWTIKPRLMGVEGVANVDTFGHRERQLQVQVDPKRLHDTGVELLQVVETTGNALWVSPLTFLEASTPGTGGFIETPRQRIGVQHQNPIVSANDLAQVAVADKPDLRLGDVATVVEDHQPLIGDGLVNGKPGLVMVIEKLPHANTVDVTKGVEAALADLRPGLKGLDFDTSLFRPADYIEIAKNNVARGLVAALVLLVILLALAFYQWRTALISAATILVSLTAGALVLTLRGATFNSMVLAGLAVALGAVVDDAITGTERVVRRLRDRENTGKSVTATIVDATLEVRGPLVFALLFVVLPVVPVFFMGEVFGAFGRPLATSYILALAASTVTAAVLTPALSVLLLSRGSAPARQSALASRLEGRYDGLLARLLGSPRPVLLTVAALALIGLVAFPQIRRSHLPALKERDFLVELEAAPGTSLTKMNQVTADITKDLSAIPGVRKVASHAGRAISSDRVNNVNSANLWVSLKPEADYAKTVKALKKVVAGHPELDRDVLTYTQDRLEKVKSGADAPIVVRVYGNEQNALNAKAREIGDKLGKVRGIKNLQVEVPAEEPTLEVEVDLEKAKEFGVKPGDVRRAAAFLISGVQVGELFYDQKVFEVVVWGTPNTRQSEADLRNLLIDSPKGGQVRLEQVANVRTVNTPVSIEREGAFRRIDLSASVAGRDRDAVAADVKDLIKATDFPLEFRAELLGTYTDKRAAESRLLALGALAALGMLLLLQACFGSWRIAVLFFTALPVALVGGVVAALAGGGGTVTIGSALGLLTVLSVTARNGILLVKRYQDLERREGQVFGLALVQRGARERLVPTIMTALATAVVFLPVVVLGDIPGYEVLHPMGIVILGGLVTGTLVNVFVTPAIYLNFGSRRSQTELDLTLFEAELAEAERQVVLTTAEPAPAANGAATAPLESVVAPGLES
jgi:CzcA family heavy metal efflux pump